MADDQNNTTYNIQQAQELEQTNLKLREQVKNLDDIAASHDKILKIQAQEMANLVRIAELRGNASAEVVAYAEAASNVNERLSDAIQLQENGFTRTAAVLRDIGEMRTAQLKLEKKFVSSLEKKLNLDEKQKEILEKSTEAQKDLIELAKVMSQITTARKNKDKDALDLLIAQRNQLKESLKEQGIQITGASKLASVYEEQYEAVDRIRDANKEMAETALKGALWKSTEKMGAALGGVTSAYGTLQGIAADMYRSTGGNLELIQNTQDALTDEDFTTFGLAQFGIGFEEISESMVNLSQRSAQFAFATKEVQTEVGITAAKLQRLGVSTETSADLFNTLRLNFGLQANQFGSMADDMVQKSQAIGITVEQYTQDFQSSFPILSQYGTGAVNVFDKLARQARASGMSVQELAQSMSQFDTFEGAAESASKLNFLLGSQLDTTELLMADEADRLDMIKGAFSPAQFENMDKFKKKAIAAAAGFSDVGAFEKAMRGDVEGLGKAAQDQADTLDSATKKSTAATLAFGKAIENTKDKVALGMVDLVDNLGTDAHDLFGAGSIAAMALGNLAGAAQMLNGAAIMQMAAAAPAVASGVGGALKSGFTKSSMVGNVAAAGGMKGAFSAGASKLGLVGKLGAGAGIAGAGIMVTKDAYDVGKAMIEGREVEGKDIGGTIGGIVGGAVGILGGPMGIAIGASVGNMLGGWAGDFLDKDEKLSDQQKKEAKEQKDRDDKQIRLQEELLEESRKGNKFNMEKKNYFDHINPGRRNSLSHANNQRTGS